jgi:hypothetical protein
MLIGPSTTTAPYLIANEPNVTITSIATVGDVLDTKSDGITPYRFVGIPDGMGAYDNGDGTITVLINHELRPDVGVVREHGATGAFVSRLVIDKTTLAVLDASDAINTVKLWDDATESFVTMACCRFDGHRDRLIHATPASRSKSMGLRYPMVECLRMGL